MKLVMTLMVRDEADIVAAMVEHHLHQGVDLIIATDNASDDGTREILAQYAATGRLELHDHPAQDKNQSAVVTGMARRAKAVHGADWVINADADEFFFPVDRSLTLREAFEMIPTALGSFTAPVINLTGRPAKDGSGVDRLILRDERTDAELNKTAGLHAQPTADAIHVGSDDVVVAQGNHRVSIKSQGQPRAAAAIEVLHLPWRSYRQFSTKVRNAGVAYTSNPTRKPSPRHHGMRDYRFLQAGVLEDFYIYRHPAPGAPASASFPADTSLRDELHKVSASGSAVVPEELARVLDDDDARDDYSPDDFARAATVVAIALPIEVERTDALAAAVFENKALRRALETSKLAATPMSLDYRVGRRVLAPARAVGRTVNRVRRWARKRAAARSRG